MSRTETRLNEKLSLLRIYFLRELSSQILKSIAHLTYKNLEMCVNKGRCTHFRKVHVET